MKLGLLAALYISQGLPFGFFTQALPVMLREQGLSLKAIGLTSLLYLPWACKFLWAPLADRFYVERWGRRRSWILPVQISTAATLLLICLIDPSTQLMWLFAAVLLCNLLAATQDIATDGLAVETLRPSERGLGNGVQVAGYRIGMIIGGGALLIVFEWLGWVRSFAAMALLILLATIPILLFREPVKPAVINNTAGNNSLIRRFLARPGILAWLGVLAVYKLGDALGTGMLRPFLVDLGLSMSDIGWLLGTAGSISSLLGALFGGWLTGRIGGYRALAAFGVLQALTIGAYTLPAMGFDSLSVLYPLCVLENFVGGMATAALFTMMMNAARDETAATDYTVQASVFVIAMGIAGGLSGFMAESLGYSSYFAISSIIAMLALTPIFIAWNRGGFIALRSA